MGGLFYNWRQEEFLTMNYTPKAIEEKIDIYTHKNSYCKNCISRVTEQITNTKVFATYRPISQIYKELQWIEKKRKDNKRKSGKTNISGF